MAESAFFKALGVENLVAAAGALGVWDKQQRTGKRLELHQGVAARAGEHKVGGGEHIRQLLIEELHLRVTGGFIKRRVKVALAADMGDIKRAGEHRQSIPQRLIDRLRAERSAHHQQNGLRAVEAQEGQALGAAAAEKLRAQGRADHLRLCAEHLRAFGEGGGDSLDERAAELIRQTGG